MDGLKTAPSEEYEELVRGEDVMLVCVEGPHKIFMIKNWRTKRSGKCNCEHVLVIFSISQLLFCSTKMWRPTLHIIVVFFVYANVNSPRFISLKTMLPNCMIPLFGFVHFFGTSLVEGSQSSWPIFPTFLFRF